MKKQLSQIAILSTVAAASAGVAVALYSPSGVQAVASSPQAGAGSLLQANPPLPPATDPHIFASLAEKVIPSVVNIQTLTLPQGGSARRRFATPEDMFREFFNPQPNRNRDWHEPRTSPRPASLGTGFVIDSSGIILTNHHVIDGADEIKIQFTESDDEVPTPGKVIGSDPELDVALIKVETNRPLIPLPLGDSDSLRVGEYVAAIGNPFGQGHSLTHGIISAKGRPAPGVALATYIQTDAPINPGNSGGPLVNLRGEVIGINNAIDARAQGIGFAIPINLVKTVLPDLQSKGTIARGYIGVVVGALNPELAEKISVKKDLKAPLVMQVEPGSPAFRAGIRPYDVITEVDGKSITNPTDLTARITALQEGEVVKVKVLRADQSREFQVKLGKRPVPQSDS